MYINIPNQEIAKTWIYRTEPCDFSSYDVSYVNSKTIENIFFYTDKIKYSTEAVYFDVHSYEVSQTYPYFDTIYAEQIAIMATVDDPSDVHYVILQPIFKNQSKVWILIKRDYSNPFPGLTGAESKFLKNGNLFLVTSADGDPQIGFTPFQPEIIPIDYSIFAKSVNKPTCYVMPEDHKLRLCNQEEAKLRTPALKVFLGEK